MIEKIISDSYVVEAVGVYKCCKCLQWPLLVFEMTESVTFSRFRIIFSVVFEGYVAFLLSLRLVSAKVVLSFLSTKRITLRRVQFLMIFANERVSETFSYREDEVLGFFPHFLNPSFFGTINYLSIVVFRVSS